MSSTDFRLTAKSDAVEMHNGSLSSLSLGQRSTRQRKLICEILKASKDHLDVETLYQRARDLDSRVSLSTVYRTIALLKEADLVDEMIFENDRRCYEMKAQNQTSHHHIRCLSCGEVYEFETSCAEHLSERILETISFQVENLRIDVSGYCKSCRHV